MSTATAAKPAYVDTPNMYPGLRPVPVDLIRPSDRNPRHTLGDLSDLAASIKAEGILEPLVVTPIDDETAAERFELVAGHRRLAAAVLAGFDRVPCVVRPWSGDDGVLVAMLTENRQRADLLPSEEAAALAELAAAGRTQRELAQLVGRSQGDVSKLISLTRLPEVAQRAVDAGGITREQGVSLAKVDPVEVEKLFAKGVPAEWQISQAVAAAKRAEEQAKRKAQVDAERAKAVEAGLTVVDELDANAGPWLLVWLRRDAVDPGSDEEHALAPCHAVYVLDSGAGDVRPLAACTDRSRHKAEPADSADGADGPVILSSRANPAERPYDRAEAAAEAERQRQVRDAENARRSQERAEEDRRREQAQADKARRLAYHRHLVGLVGVNKIMGLAAVMLPMAGDNTNLADVARALGVPLFEVTVTSEPGCDDPTCCDAEACPETWVGKCSCGDEAEFDTQADALEWAGHGHQEADDPEWEEIVPKLHAYAARDIRNQAQVVYALALAVGEEYAEPKAWMSWQGAVPELERRLRAHYLDFLAAEGYELSDLERSWLATDEPADSAPEVDEQNGSLWDLLAEHRALADRWGKSSDQADRLAMVQSWSLPLTAPGSRFGDQEPVKAADYDHCTPTDLWRDRRDLGADEMEHRGACLGCGWVSETVHFRENAAVEDAHDHAFPGWRDLPVVDRPPVDTSPAKAAKYRAKIEPLLPEGWFDRGGPIRTNRQPMGTRHVSFRAPGGGYDLCANEAECRAILDAKAADRASTDPHFLEFPSAHLLVAHLTTDHGQPPDPQHGYDDLDSAHRLVHESATAVDDEPEDDLEASLAAARDAGCPGDGCPGCPTCATWPEFGEILIRPQADGADAWLVECEACGGDIGLPAFADRETAELARHAHVDSAHATAGPDLATAVCVALLDSSGGSAVAMPWPAILRPFKAWDALRTSGAADVQKMAAEEATGVCEALAAHRSHGGAIPWPEVVEALDAWGAADAIAKAAQP